MPKLNINNLEITKSERYKNKNPHHQTLKRLNATIESLKEEIEELKLKSKTAVKRDRANAWRQKKYRIFKSTKEVREMAVELFYFRLRREAGRKTAYVDAVSGYPVMCKFLEGIELEHKYFCVLITCYHFRFICRKELMYYGYTYDEAAKYLTGLVRRGYLNKDTRYFAQSSNYTCLPKGERLVEEFHNFYKKQTQKMFEEFKLKHKHHYVKPLLINRAQKRKGEEENGDQQND